MFTSHHINRFSNIETPFYYYNTGLLSKTLNALTSANTYNFHIHYALKANSNPIILNMIKNHGLGADCVSGNEVLKAIECGFPVDKIVFAGVGKSDKEILNAINHNILCFNVESIPELLVLNELAAKQKKKINIALRINPNVDAYTHKYITTGLEENKFGINPYEFNEVESVLSNCNFLSLIGLHFHIGSQIQDLTPFKNLCLKINELNKWFLHKGHNINIINVGGGLGVDYKNPNGSQIVDFDSYFKVFHQFLEPLNRQQIHFELGRSIVAQCGSLISKVLYIKKGINTNFAILDAGMTELIRPALYQAYHHIENLSANNLEQKLKYDVVGPICESSDCFGKAVFLPETKRGDIIAIRTAGAYGEVMSSKYNLRDEVKSYFDV
ncbi:MAG: diaminopimelate decarboxylase [Bacteroidetes bacterium]|nr:diaminopimelate decarboxylase [Bacteroidota bacterium]